MLWKCPDYKDNRDILMITPMVVGVICNFHFHYGSNLTSSGIQVESMQNVNCTLKITIIRCVLYAKMHFTNCHKLSIFFFFFLFQLKKRNSLTVVPLTIIMHM